MRSVKPFATYQYGEVVSFDHDRLLFTETDTDLFTVNYRNLRELVEARTKDAGYPTGDSSVFANGSLHCRITNAFSDIGRPRSCALAPLGPIHRRAQTEVASARRSDIHEEASVKTKEQDEYGTAQTSIRHHPQQRSAMREYAVAPIHTSGVAVRHVGPRDAT